MGSYIIREYLFQSLFFWMTLWKSFLQTEPRKVLCFNPCFSGWRSESALLWVLDLDIGVSILVFLDDALKAVSFLNLKVTDEFQSLFFWMTLWKSSSWWKWRHDPNVSILVFLDDALKASLLKDSSIPSDVSILVFLDDALKEDGRRGPAELGAGFQSLFFWMTLWKIAAEGR